MTPTGRSLNKLRKEGYLAGVVEKRIPKCFILKDLFGFIDIVAVRENEVLGVQTTTTDNQASRVKKILGSENYLIVKSSGMKIIVHGWSKRKKRWFCNVTEL